MSTPGVKPLAMRADDEGAINIIITQDPGSGMITIDFGKPVHWFALSRKETQELALRLLRMSADKVMSYEVPDQNEPAGPGA